MADQRFSFSSHSSKREVGDPGGRQRLGIDQLQLLTEAQAEPPHGVGGGLGPIHAEEQEVPLLAAHPLAEALQDVRPQELGDGRLDTVGADLEPGEPLRAEPLGELLELIELAPGIAPAPLGIQGHGPPPGIERLGEGAERGPCEEVSHVLELQAEPDVRRIQAEPPDRLMRT